MTSNEILHADLLDILFENRNKQYGAYTFRKNYNSGLLFPWLSQSLCHFFLPNVAFDHSISGKLYAIAAG